MYVQYVLSINNRLIRDQPFTITHTYTLNRGPTTVHIQKGLLEIHTRGTIHLTSNYPVINPHKRYNTVMYDSSLSDCSAKFESYIST